MPLIFLINLSFETGVFPETLKKAIISPVLKSGDKRDVGNYRPISNLSVFSKLFENAFCNRLISYLDKFNLLDNCQHGFRKDRNTSTAVSNFVNQLMASKKEKKDAYGIFYDYTKAFDSVDHVMLMEKLKNYGIRGAASEWIKSFLYNRRQSVKIINQLGTHHSREVNMTVGVPQGATISPILFILFTNDLAKTMIGDLTTYADDTTQLICDNNKSIYTTCKEAVSRMTNWSLTNGLKLNSKKTVLINFNTTVKPPGYDTNPLVYLDGKSIQVLNETKFLGLIIDNKLKWEAHINKTALSVASGCFLVNKIMKTCNFNSAKAVYFAYVHAKLNYGITLWGHSPHALKLFILQKRAVRHLANASHDPTTPGVYYKDSCRPLFMMFNILPLPCLYIYSIIVYVIRYKKVDVSMETNDHIMSRRNNGIHLAAPNVILNEKSPVAIGIRIFNKLPNALKCKAHQQDFMVSLMSFLQKNCFYSLHEYFNL
jgi:hypothetical protein